MSGVLDERRYIIDRFLSQIKNETGSVHPTTGSCRVVINASSTRCPINLISGVCFRQPSWTAHPPRGQLILIHSLISIYIEQTQGHLSLEKKERKMKQMMMMMMTLKVTRYPLCSAVAVVASISELENFVVVAHLICAQSSCRTGNNSKECRLFDYDNAFALYLVRL